MLLQVAFLRMKLVCRELSAPSIKTPFQLWATFPLTLIFSPGSLCTGVMSREEGRQPGCTRRKEKRLRFLSGSCREPSHQLVEEI